MCCDSIEAFNNLLRSNSNIAIENNTLKYNQITVGYEVQPGKVKEQQFFHVKFSFNFINKFDSDLNDYNALLKTFRKIVHLLDIEFNCLWDDISLYYSTKAYPLINEIVSDLREKLQKAVDKLDKIQISEDEKETTVENMEAVREASEPRKRFLRALQAGGKEVLMEWLDNPYVNIAVATLKAWEDTK